MNITDRRRSERAGAGATARQSYVLALLVVLLAAAGCGDNPDAHPPLQQGALMLPEEPLNYEVDLPFYYEVNTLLQTPFQTSALFNDNTPEDNPVTNDGATLGRVLFYDVRLSSANPARLALLNRWLKSVH